MPKSYSNAKASSGSGSGDVTHTGTLTAFDLIAGNGGADITRATYITATGDGALQLGDTTSNTTGFLYFKNDDSGTLGLSVPQGAPLGTVFLTLPAVDGTITVNDAAQPLTNKTIDGDNNTITNISRLKVDADNTLPATCAKGEVVVLDNGTFWSGQATNDWQQVLTASDIGGVRAVTGTTDTVLSTDFSKMVTYTNAGTIAVTLPQAGSGSPAAFTSGWYFTVQNIGSTTVTITPTTSTINGAASLVLLAGQFATIFSNGTNYLATFPVNAVSGITFAGTALTTMTFPPASASVGYLNIPQNSQSAAYTTVLADAGKHILHPTADNNARTFTIDSNANVAYPVGTAITFINQINTVTIAITSDTLTLAGAGTTGSRTLAASGVATAVKIATTSWIISGTGLT